jgi:hypothetical protein
MQTGIRPSVLEASTQSGRTWITAPAQGTTQNRTSSCPSWPRPSSPSPLTIRHTHSGSHTPAECGHGHVSPLWPQLPTQHETGPALPLRPARLQLCGRGEASVTAPLQPTRADPWGRRGSWKSTDIAACSHLFHTSLRNTCIYSQLEKREHEN